MSYPTDEQARAAQWEVEQFLFREAEVLDGWQLQAWMGMITSDIDYRIPIRITPDASQEDAAFSSQSFHMIEDHGSLAARMKRIDGGFAFSERPRSRVRRHVSNVRLKSFAGDETTVYSNVLFFWGRDNLERIISAERRDVLRRVEGRLLLAHRMVLLDHVALPLPNLTIVI